MLPEPGTVWVFVGSTQSEFTSDLPYDHFSYRIPHSMFSQGNGNSLYDLNHLLPGEFQDNVFGLPTGFLSNHTSIQAAEGCNTQLLPTIPTCPGPYFVTREPWPSGNTLAW